jgi:hypothetical protein
MWKRHEVLVLLRTGDGHHGPVTDEPPAAPLKKHLVERKPVSDACNEAGIQPSVFSTLLTSQTLCETSRLRKICIGL